MILQPVEQDPRWQALLTRDKTADGKFYYSVKTTGVYCRPSCGARTPRPENVQFHDTTRAAEQAGFRPCKRCRPDQLPLARQHAAAIADICRRIESSEAIPRLDELAAETGLSSYYFHRLFKSITGLTPKAYAAGQRARRMCNHLKQGGTVTSAILDAGYNANSRFYENSAKLLGMKPSQYKAGGLDTEIRFAVGQCSLGAILVASTSVGICSIMLGDDAETLVQSLQDAFPRASLLGGDAEFEQLVARVVGFIEIPQASLDLPLDIRGTVFQQRVWQALSSIPPGTTMTYADLAQRIGAPKAIRAVASACASNKLAVAIPCHRVVRTDGSLSGYRWGIERKQALLERESNQKTASPNRNP